MLTRVTAQTEEFTTMSLVRWSSTSVLRLMLDLVKCGKVRRPLPFTKHALPLRMYALTFVSETRATMTSSAISVRRAAIIICTTSLMIATAAYVAANNSRAPRVQALVGADHD